MTLIPLGFAVGSGDSVAIPLGHMAVTGQTQAAGKTTALEALAARSDRHVLAFVTKRGESGFEREVRTIPPFFRERADWQFVEAVLEATMRERMKYERQWIMKVSRTATNLADVRANTAEALHRAKGEFMRGTYEKLLAYLDIVVPQISKIRWGPGVALVRGVNVMQLSAMSSEMQALVIASCLDQIMTERTDTIVIIPEAWEFVPRGRKSPVTLSAEAFVRKGAALKNYLWIDSQDLAGVHTPLLKQMHVFLLGVQREINEIKRTIAHLHGPAKPKPETIAQLGLGQFVVCHGSTAVTTYVQPAWMEEKAARKIACGEFTPPIARPPGFHVTDVGRLDSLTEDAMDAALKQERDNLKAENQELREQIRELKAQVAQVHNKIPKTELESWGIERRPGTTPLKGRPLDDDGAIKFSKPGDLPYPASSFYLEVRERLLKDADVQAALVKITASRPEILIELTPKTITFDGGSPKGRLARMVANGLFNEPIKPGVAIKEFKRTGGEIHPSRLSEHLGEFVVNGFLLREGDTYVKAPGLKVTTKELQAV